MGKQKSVNGKIETKKIKLLWYGDICCKTGFSIVTENILTRLYNTGLYDISVLGLNYRGDYNPLQKIFKIWPVSDRDLWGVSKMQAILNEVKPDIVLTLNDVDCLTWFAEQRIKFVNNQKWIWYAPLDSSPNHPNALNSIMNCDRFITFTHWGKRELEKQIDGVSVDVVPHGTDTNNFFKIKDKAEIRRLKSDMCKHPNPYLVGFVGRNQYRKEIPRLLEAFKTFSEDKDNAYLYLHCCPVDSAPGYPLPEIIRYLGLESKVIFPTGPDGRFISPGQGISTEDLNKMYNIMDVFVLPSNAGGWELPLTEAMGAEVPVITTNYAAMSEVAGQGRGILVDVDTMYWFVGNNLGRKGIPSVSGLTDAMNKVFFDQLFNDGKMCKEMISAGKKFVNDITWDYVASEFNRIILEEYSKPYGETVLNKKFEPGASLNKKYSKYDKIILG